MIRRVGTCLVVAMSALLVGTTQAARATTYYQAVQADTWASVNGTWDVFLNPVGQITSVNCGASCDGPWGYAWSEATGASVDVGADGIGCGFETCFYTATSINGSNQVSGWIQGKTPSCAGDQAFTLNIVTDKYTLMRCQSDAYFVNAAGQLFGGYQNSSGVERAFMWSGGTFTDLGTLGGAGAFATSSAATGQAVGCAQTKASAWHPFLYKNGKMTDLGLPAGFSNGCAYSINANGLVLGGDGATPKTNYGTGFGECRLFTRTSAGKFTVINPPASTTCITGEHIDVNGVVGVSSNYLGSPGWTWKAGTLTAITAANVPFGDLANLQDIQIPKVEGVFATNSHGQLAADVWDADGSADHVVLFTPLKIYDDTNSAITYSAGGNQTEVSVSGAWGSDLHQWFFDGAGYTATLTFTGRSVRIVGEMGPNLYTASVALDGASAGTISENQSTTTQRQTIFQYQWATSGKHTITITPNGAFTLDAIATTAY